MFLLISGQNGHQIWIGGNKFYGNWRWDGIYKGDITVTDWYAGQPDNLGGYENCLQLMRDGTWNDHFCSAEFPFICEMKAF